MVSVPCLLLADIRQKGNNHGLAQPQGMLTGPMVSMVADTVKTLKSAAKPDTKVKEVAKAKKQPKPEKVDEGADAKKEKSKRQRRPDGMERPPEIPRRIDN